MWCVSTELCYCTKKQLQTILKFMGMAVSQSNFICNINSELYLTFSCGLPKNSGNRRNRVGRKMVVKSEAVNVELGAWYLESERSSKKEARGLP